MAVTTKNKSKKKIALSDKKDPRVKKAATKIKKSRACEVVLTDTVDEALSLLKSGKVDGVVTGSIDPTSIVLKKSFKKIGTKGKVSGAFLMKIGREKFLFADCAVNPNPTSRELAKIAIDSSNTYKNLTGKKPIVAMLSFSTNGSARGEMVSKVQRATKLVKKKTKIKVIGEIQMDAALVLSIAKKKGVKNYKKPNVFIFPDLNSGNICYKAVERFAKAKAIGPILQGMKKPVNDLSRGCSVEDIVELVKITALQ